MKKENQIKILPSGDSAFLLSFGEEISEEINQRVFACESYLRNQIEKGAVRGIIGMVPAYTTLLVLFDPMEIRRWKLERILRNAVRNNSESKEKQGRLVEIPVCYGGTFGPDLADVAKFCGMSEEEVISRHCGRDYQVYMMGFLPGFPYLGNMDPAIAIPRLDTPRVKIPAGSVGIGGSQTGIYPLESPGGWRLIGRSPVLLFSPEEKEPFLLSAGDKVRFVPIDEKMFREMAKCQ